MAVKNPIFKILRCPGCGKQNRHIDPLPPATPCPRCAADRLFSTDWYIKVIVNNKPHIQAVSRQKQHAESALKKAEAEIFYDDYQINQEWPLLSEAITALYKIRWKKKKDGEGTRRRAELLTEAIGDVPINTIGKRHMQVLAVVLGNRGTGDSTANRYRSVLRSILKHYDLPYRFIPWDPETEGRICVLTDQEEKQIITLFQNGPRDRRREFYAEMPDFISCLIDTGARPNELLKLPPGDINFDTNMLTIWINKTDKPRSIPMTPRTKRILKKRTADNRKILFDLDIYQADNAWDWVRKQMGREEDEDFVLYACRHTSVTRQLIAGADAVKVKEWHGHKSLSTTMRYTHLAPHDLTPTLKLLEKRRLSTNRQRKPKVTKK